MKNCGGKWAQLFNIAGNNRFTDLARAVAFCRRLRASFLAPLANKWLPGVGPKLAGVLNTGGLAIIEQIDA